MQKVLVAAALVASFSAGAFASVQDNLALGKTTTASSFYDGGSEVFQASNIVDGITTDAGSAYNWSFWLAAQGQNQGSWVQVDLGNAYNINNVTLFDTHNRGYYDRGTNAFTLSVSTDGLAFHDVASSSFTYDEWTNQTAKSVDVSSAVGRYVRFNVNSVYGGESAGLAEMKVFGTVAAVPEPETYAMLLAGLGLIGAAVKRRKTKQA